MVTIKRNRNANNNINRAYENLVIENLVQRISKNYVVPLNNIKRNGRYAILNNNGVFQGFAIVSNYGNTRTLELIATRKGYGKTLLNRIINNAKQNNKQNISLMAIHPRLVNWYRQFGFVPSQSVGPYIPMKRVLRNKPRGLRFMNNSNSN